MFLGDVELDALFEDHGVSCMVIEDVLTRQSTSGALRSNCHTQTNRGSTDRCARFLQDLVAAAVLPPHSADFPLQLLDFAHAWSERRDKNIHIFDVLSLAAADCIAIKADPGWAFEPRYT